MNFTALPVGIHYPEVKDAELGMIYHLHSLVHKMYGWQA